MKLAKVIGRVVLSKKTARSRTDFSRFFPRFRKAPFMA